MSILEFRQIPGYEQYGVTRDGVIKSLPRDLILKQYDLNGYLIVDTFRGSNTETLPVHRAVALAWVDNPDPTEKIIVNHMDGDKVNNCCDNLEWVTYSENNYHAVNTGLRSDNVPCQVRAFDSGEVHNFWSISQACVFMGFSSHMPICMLIRKQFGALIKDNYEFKFLDDARPWFYESRRDKISPARYMVEVFENNTLIEEVYSNKSMLVKYQLYDSPYGKSMYGLVKHANEKFTSKLFVLHDGYTQMKHYNKSNVTRKPPIGITAKNLDLVIEFDSLRSTAKYFEVDRSTITNRLNKDLSLDGWFFTNLPS